MCFQISRPSPCSLQGDQGDQGPRVCGFLQLLVTYLTNVTVCLSLPAELWAKGLRCMKFCRQCSSHVAKHNVCSIMCKTPWKHPYKIQNVSSWGRYLLNLGCNQKPSCSILIITRDSLQSSPWHGALGALIISSSVVWHVFKSAAPKWWWWCECLSVLDRLWN